MSNDMETQEPMGIRAAASYLETSTSQVYALINTGRLDVVMVADRKAVTKSSVLKYAQDRGNGKTRAVNKTSQRLLEEVRKIIRSDRPDKDKVVLVAYILLEDDE